MDIIKEKGSTVPRRACVCMGGHLETPKNPKQGP